MVDTTANNLRTMSANLTINAAVAARNDPNVPVKIFTRIFNLMFDIPTFQRP